MHVIFYTKRRFLVFTILFSISISCQVKNRYHISNRMIYEDECVVIHSSNDSILTKDSLMFIRYKRIKHPFYQGKELTPIIW